MPKIHFARHWQSIKKYLLSHSSLITAAIIFIILLVAYVKLLPPGNNQPSDSGRTESGQQTSQTSSAGSPATPSPGNTSGNMTETSHTGTASAETTHTEPVVSPTQAETSATQLPTTPTPETTSGIPTVKPGPTPTMKPAPSPAPTQASSTETRQTDTTTSGTEPQTTYYVSSSGNDRAPGTAASPFRTIQWAIDQAEPDSIIYVSAGTYPERLDFTDKHHLTVTGLPSVRPVLSGRDFSDGYLIEISAASNIKIANLEITDFRGNDLECILIRRGSRDILIESCLITNIGLTGSTGNAHVILAKGDSKTPLRNLAIIGNRIYNCQTGYSEVITMESNVDGFIIRNNRIYDVSNIAIDATGFYANGVRDAALNQARNGVIARNVVYNVVAAYTTCAAIYVDGGRDILIEYNRVYNSMYGIEVGCENKFDEENPSVAASASDIIVRHNTVYGCSKAGLVIGGYDMSRTGLIRDCRVSNNTFYKNKNEITLAYCDGVSLEKNILFGSGQDNYYIYHYETNKLSRFAANWNIYYTDQGSGRFKLNGQYAADLAGWQEISGQDAEASMIDPQFISPQTGNFELESGSPAAGFGA